MTSSSACAILLLGVMLAAACGNGAAGSTSSCSSVCDHASAAGCAKFNASDCVTSCQKEQANAACAREFDAVASCFSTATVTCDKHGEPDVGSACDAQQAAYDKCVTPPSDGGHPVCALPNVPSSSTCSAAPPTPGTACSKKCDACTAPAGVLWGPCVCDGSHWICRSDVGTSWPCDVTCP